LSNKTLVLGLGNILLKDEGIGVHIAHLLQKSTLPKNIEIIDGGTSSLDILLSLRNIDKLIIIDALKCEKKPGTIYRMTPDDFEVKVDLEKLSLHQMGLIETITILKRMGNLPQEIVIIGIEPEKIEPGTELSDTIKERLKDIESAVLHEINRKTYEYIK